MNEQYGGGSANHELLRIYKLGFTYVSFINLHFIMLMLFFFYDLAYDSSINR